MCVDRSGDHSGHGSRHGGEDEELRTVQNRSDMIQGQLEASGMEQTRVRQA